MLIKIPNFDNWKQISARTGPNAKTNDQYLKKAPIKLNKSHQSLIGAF